MLHDLSVWIQCLCHLHTKGVMVQLNKVEVCELKPKVLTKDEGDLVWKQTSN